MDTDVDNESTESASPAQTPSSSEAPAYVRRRTPHKTQPPVNDLAQDETVDTSESHESSLSVGRSKLSGRGYRRSRSELSQVQKDNKYGRYLEVPKGGRSIFESSSLRKHRRRVTIAVVVVAALVIALVLWLILH